jgi:hypothetical protein
MITRPRSASLLVAGAAGFVGAVVASTWPTPAVAQDQAPRLAEVGRYQISTIPGAVYMVDTRTANVWVRAYTDKTWRPAGNPLSK